MKTIVTLGLLTGALVCATALGTLNAIAEDRPGEWLKVAQAPGTEGQQADDQKNENGEKGQRGEGQKGQRGEGEKGQRGEGEKGQRGEGEKGQRGEGEKGQRSERGRGQRNDGGPPPDKVKDNAPDKVGDPANGERGDRANKGERNGAADRRDAGSPPQNDVPQNTQQNTQQNTPPNNSSKVPAEKDSRTGYPDGSYRDLRIKEFQEKQRVQQQKKIEAQEKKLQLQEQKRDAQQQKNTPAVVKPAVNQDNQNNAGDRNQDARGNGGRGNDAGRNDGRGNPGSNVQNDNRRDGFDNGNARNADPDRRNKFDDSPRGQDSNRPQDSKGGLRTGIDKAFGFNKGFDNERRARIDEAKERRREFDNSRRQSGNDFRSLDDLKSRRTERRIDGGRGVVIEEPDRRQIFREGNKTIIRHDETDRFRRTFRDVRSERRQDGLQETVMRRPGGDIVTIQDKDGRLLRRFRRLPGGREVTLIDNGWDRRGRDNDRQGKWWRRGRDRGLFGGLTIDLAPPVVRIPRREYIVDYDRASDEEIYDTLSAPPVERIDRRYTLDEIRFSQPLRDRMRRIDLDAINFNFGSWEVGEDQYRKLERIADGMLRVIDRSDNEIFLIEGHTDAVGSDDDNLTLSDRRAESVAVILTEQFGVPAENLTTQGYGEQYLKIPTEAPERQNRRVAVRRITPLLSQNEPDGRR